MEATSPIPSLSSGTKEICAICILSLEICSGDLPEITTSFPCSFTQLIVPSAIGQRFVIASSSSFCPLPAIPATPRISPPKAVKLTSSSDFTPSLSRQVRPDTFRISLGFSGSGRSIFRLTFSPTIISVSELSVASHVFTVPIYLPLRKTETLSESASTSCNLCVMIIIERPSALMFLSTANNFSVSCGVRTAVGSSKIRMSEPR